MRWASCLGRKPATPIGVGTAAIISKIVDNIDLIAVIDSAGIRVPGEWLMLSNDKAVGELRSGFVELSRTVKALRSELRVKTHGRDPRAVEILIGSLGLTSSCVSIMTWNDQVL